MEKFIYKTKQEMGAAAAAAAAQAINKTIEDKGSANIILATGTSQLEMLKNLAKAETVDFSKVTMFHLDEYIDMGADHPASFRKFLKERFVDLVPDLKAVHFVNGDSGDPQQECQRVGSLIAEHPIDAAMVGIGENGHLAFNDPPALYAAKKQVIDELLDLDMSPKMIVQTNPIEHSAVANDCAIDFYRWAESGTKIRVNGRDLTVSQDGLFMENVSLSRDHTIVVEAEHEKGSKKIVRSFEVLY